MVPNVTNWILLGAIVLVAVWVGFLIMAVQWVLNNALVPLALFVAAVVLIAVADEARRHRHRR